MNPGTIVAFILLFVLIASLVIQACRRKKDAYDLAVEWLTLHPEQIQSSWAFGSSISDSYRPAVILFSMVGPTGFDSQFGCLTQIKCKYPSNTQLSHPFYDQIVQDRNIPDEQGSIRVEHLPAFAKWQRKIDKLYGRTPPVWRGLNATSAAS